MTSRHLAVLCVKSEVPGLVPQPTRGAPPQASLSLAATCVDSPWKLSSELPTECVRMGRFCGQNAPTCGGFLPLVPRNLLTCSDRYLVPWGLLCELPLPRGNCRRTRLCGHALPGLRGVLLGVLVPLSPASHRDGSCSPSSEAGPPGRLPLCRPAPSRQEGPAQPACGEALGAASHLGGSCDWPRVLGASVIVPPDLPTRPQALCPSLGG